jgi:hypothetical protein
MHVAVPTFTHIRIFMAWCLIKQTNNSALHFKTQGISIADEENHEIRTENIQSMNQGHIRAVA